MRMAPENNDNVLCLHNISSQPVSVTGLLNELKTLKSCVDLLTGRRYVQNGSDVSLTALDGFQTLWLQSVDNS
jgi:hypothetical protein